MVRRKQPYKDLGGKLVRELDKQVRTLGQEEKRREETGAGQGEIPVGLPKAWKGDRILFSLSWKFSGGCRPRKRLHLFWALPRPPRLQCREWTTRMESEPLSGF